MGEQGGTTTSRRRFLGTAAGATGVALGAAVWGSGQANAASFPQGGAQPLMADKRGFVAGKFTLALDGVQAGWLAETEGGGAVADVVNEKLGADHITKKHLAGVKYEDISVQMGFAMNKAVYDWIAASWSANFVRMNGAITATDFQGNAQQQREFFHALITETGIPACDASLKQAGHLTLKFSPELTRTTKASGGVSTQKQDQQKAWLPSNFRLKIDGLDCTKVSKIDAFTVKQTVVQSPIGEGRDYEQEPARTEFPNLRITLLATSAQSWFDWHQDFVVRGNCSDEDEKSGTLEFLSSNLKDVLAKIELFNIGIFKLEDGVFDPVNEPSATVRAELYVERMLLKVGAEPPPSP